jgi:hypothetical protein
VASDALLRDTCASRDLRLWKTPRQWYNGRAEACESPQETEEDEDEAVMMVEGEVVARKRRQWRLREEAIVVFAIGFIGSMQLTLRWLLPSCTVRVRTILRTQLMMALNQIALRTPYLR